MNSLRDRFDPPYLNVEYFFHQIYDFFSSIGQYLNSIYLFLAGETDGILNAELLWILLGVLASIIAIILIIAIIYSMVRAYEIHKDEDRKVSHFIPEDDHIKSPENPRWEKVLEYMESNDENKWRMAIIEADSMLDDMVEAIPHEGETLGERLKNMKKSQFVTIEQAWEAHKIRNKIAHQGSDYVLTEKKAQRVIKLYEQVFKEFGYI